MAATILAILWQLYLSVPIAVAANDPANQRRIAAETPILLVQNDWASQKVMARIVGDVLVESGFTVELVPFDSQLQFQALADGQVHFQVAAWEGPMHDAFYKAVEQGMIDAGTHTAITREGWWIPDYVLDQCPTATSWSGLNNCAYLFATDKTAPAGQFIGAPSDWGKNHEKRIEALQLKFKLVNAENAANLWTALAIAYKKQHPIVLFNWTPNFTDVVYEGSFVEFPEPTAECENDPLWGPNPKATGDCGEPHSLWLKKAAWKGLPQAYPAAWSILEKINFTNRQIAKAIHWVEIEGKTTEEAAKLWQNEFADVVNKWLDDEG